jgi:hypothetical protein
MIRFTPTSFTTLLIPNSSMSEYLIYKDSCQSKDQRCPKTTISSSHYKKQNTDEEPRSSHKKKGYGRSESFRDDDGTSSDIMK